MDEQPLSQPQPQSQPDLSSGLDFVQRLSTWLMEHRAAEKDKANDGQLGDVSGIRQQEPLPSWVCENLQPRMVAPSPSAVAVQVDISTLIPQLERLSTLDPSASPLLQQHYQLRQQQKLQQQQHHHHPGPSATFKRSVAKHKQSWRRTRPENTTRRATARRLLSATSESSSKDKDGNDQQQYNATLAAASGAHGEFNEKRSARQIPHDILLAIFSHLPSRANAQQYYDRTQPSDLISCSRVNMAWRIAALSTIWQTIILPDPLDRSCRRLLHLLASSHASAKITGKNYDITEIVQRVEVDLLEATEQLADEMLRDRTMDREGPYVFASMTDHITTLLQYISPFRTLSIQLPQEIELSAAEVLTKTTSVPTLEAIVNGIHDAKIRELDMPSPMYCSVSTFPGMLSLISNLHDLRSLILGYSSRDWPLLKAIISLPFLENLCVFDSSWSNQIWIYLLSSLGLRLRGLTVLQGRRPLQGIVLQDGIAPYCQNLTSISIPFIQIMSGPGPVLKDVDLIPVIKACHQLQNINVSGQRLLGDAVLEAIADLWGLQTLDIRDCSLMTGQNIKSVRWRSIQRVRLFGCGELSQEFMDLILQVWRSSNANRLSPAGTGPSGVHATIRFASVLDFNADVEDPVEMGWVRQKEDEPPLDLDEDHFFADWYC
ncbi:hypothetical protein BGZ51_002749 [Haplosporangium sp. Z 767]|nr:hypothetical protein BGZ51_002749 [Haplosporangium sp. Z 767]